MNTEKPNKSDLIMTDEIITINIVIVMHAYLIVGQNLPSVNTEIESLRGRLSVSLRYTPINTIDDVKNLQKNLKLTQMHKTAFVVENIDNATQPALNAFLKNLEEPQENVIFILTTKLLEHVLPTIVSRCLVIKAKQTTSQPENLSKILTLTISEKFKFMEKFKDRDTLISFLTSLVYYLHHLIKLPTYDKNILAMAISICSKTITNLKANGNLGLNSTNFVIRLAALNMKLKEV